VTEREQLSDDKYELPVFPGDLRKNDALFLNGAMTESKPYVFTFEQTQCEVVHGPSCAVSEEIYVEKCKEEKVPVIARRGGGGTVVLSEGMCIIVIVGERNGRFALPIFNQIHSAVIALLSASNIKGLQQQGISDITINNKKILGSSLYLGTRPDYYYYQSCLMVASAPELISRYLKYPPREPQYRMNREHGEFCTTLKNEGYDESVNAIAKILSTGLPGILKNR